MKDGKIEIPESIQPTQEQLKKMFRKEHLQIYTNVDDFLMMLGCALRYSLGRRTYVTSMTPAIIKDNVNLISKKWFVNFLRDLCDYEVTRTSWSDKDYSYDDLCDFTSWTNLKKFLVDEYEKRGFEESLEDHQGIFKTVLTLYFRENGERRFVGAGSTINETFNLMYDFLEERGTVPPYHRSIMKHGFVFYDICSATEWFELDTLQYSENYPRDDIREAVAARLAALPYPFADLYNEKGELKYP